MQSEEVVHPAEDALAHFQPDKNQIDKVLFNGIVDEIPVAGGRRLSSLAPRLSGNTDNLKADELKELISSEGLQPSEQIGT